MAEVAEGIYRLGTRWINWYLVEEGGKLTVIDSGLPRHWSQLPRVLSALGRRPEDVEVVLLTHAHPDHLGTAERIRSETEARVKGHSAGVPVALGERAARAPQVARHVWRPFVIRFFLAILRDGVASVPHLARVETFEDGERLDVPGRPRVIHTPGHTPDSCAFWLQDRGVLFSGDGLVTLDALSGKRRVCVSAAPFNHDSRQALASLGRLEGVAAGTVLPGHGDPWGDGVEEALRLARRAGVRDGPAGTGLCCL